MFFNFKSGCVFLSLICLPSRVGGQTVVSFDQDEYVVSSVGETFEVKVLIDADQRSPELDPIRDGLFSFGTSIAFDSAKANASDIQIASELDDFGFGDGGFKDMSPGTASGKGNINQNLNPLEPYGDSLLMTVTLTNLSAPIDLYPLSLDFFRTLGNTEQLFVTGSGGVLDSEIVFETSVVRVIPEPSAFYQAFSFILIFVFRRRNRPT